MPDDALQQVLRLVADGRLTAEEAAPILAALDDDRPATAAEATARPNGERSGSLPPRAPEPPSPPAAPGSRPAALRIEVREGAGQIVNLRLPLALGRFALDRVPGLSLEHSSRVREALENGVRGPILEVADDDGSGVRIVVE